MTAVNNNASPMDGAPVIDFDKFKPTRSFTAARKRKDLAMRVLIALAFIVALIPLFSVLLTTIVNGVKRLNLNFLSYNMTGVVGGNPTPSGGYGGIQHAIIGTLEITFGAMIISIPIGLMCAVYLVEYSNRGKLARVITLLVDVMSGILIEGQKTVQNGVDVYDFTYINWFWIGAALLSVLFALLVWNAKSKEVD
jgi:phosphate transport system permease protein